MALGSLWSRRGRTLLVLMGLVVLVVALGRMWQGGDSAETEPPIEAADPAPQIRSGSVTITRTRTIEPDNSPEGRLVSAARSGRLGELRDLLDRGVSPDALDRNGDMPLHQAARGDQMEALEELLAAGANPGEPDGIGWNPLAYATYGASLRCAQRLLRAGAGSREYAVSPFDPIISGWLAARVGAPNAPPERERERLAIVETLFEAGVEPPDLSGLLRRAIKVLKDEQLVVALLARGAILDESPGMDVSMLMQLHGPIGDRLREAFPDKAPRASSP